LNPSGPLNCPELKRNKLHARNQLIWLVFSQSAKLAAYFLLATQPGPKFETPKKNQSAFFLFRGSIKTVFENEKNL